MVKAVSWLCPHMTFPRCVCMQSERSPVSPPVHKDTNSIMGTPPLWSHLNLITSQRFHLQTPSHWGQWLQHMNLGRHIQSIAKWNPLQCLRWTISVHCCSHLGVSFGRISSRGGLLYHYTLPDTSSNRFQPWVPRARVESMLRVCLYLRTSLGLINSTILPLVLPGLCS